MDHPRCRTEQNSYSNRNCRRFREHDASDGKLRIKRHYQHRKQWDLWQAIHLLWKVKSQYVSNRGWSQKNRISSVRRLSVGKRTVMWGKKLNVCSFWKAVYYWSGLFFHDIWYWWKCAGTTCWWNNSIQFFSQRSECERKRIYQRTYSGKEKLSEGLPDSRYKQPSGNIYVAVILGIAWQYIYS